MIKKMDLKVGKEFVIKVVEYEMRTKCLAQAVSLILMI